MSSIVKLLLIISLSVAGLANPAFLGFAKDYAELVPGKQLARVKRSMTTICVEVRPASSNQEPYYMCKGADVPKAKYESPQAAGRPIPNRPTSPYSERGNYDAREVSNSYHPMFRSRSEPYVGFRAPTDAYQEVTIREHARPQVSQFEDEFKRQAARELFPGLMSQEQPFPAYRKTENKANFKPQYYNLYDEARAQAPFGYHFDRAHVHQPGPPSPPTTLAQDNFDTTPYYAPFSRNAGLGAFQKTRDIEQGVLPVNEAFHNLPNINFDQPPQYNQYAADEYRKSQNYFDNPDFGLDLQDLMQPPTMPAEYMDDPILRAFYNSLPEQFPPANSNGFMAQDTKPSKPIKAQPVAPVAQQYRSEEVTTTSLPPTNTCASCQNTKSQISNSEPEQVSTYRNGKSSYPQQELNWPPLVIAMPCCGQQANNGMQQNTFSTPHMAFGFNPNFMMPMTPMSPMMPMTQMSLERTASANEETTPNHSTTDLPETKSTQPIFKELRGSVEETTIPATTIIETTIAQAEARTINEDNQDSEESETTIDPMLSNTQTEVTTILAIPETTEAMDNGASTQQTFRAMLNRAKMYKERSEGGVSSESFVMSGRKKGKRQNNQDSAGKLNNYNRQYMSMLR